MSNRASGPPEGTVSDLTARRIERRTFMRGLGATVAAGLGLAVLPGNALATGSRRPAPSPDRGMQADTCGIWCSPTGDCSSQTYCLGGSNHFYCVSQCNSSDNFDLCTDGHGCGAGFCYSQGC